MKKFFLAFCLICVFGCAATVSKDLAEQYYEYFPVQILNSLTMCEANSCTFAIKVQLSSKKLFKLACYFQPQGLNIPPILMDTYERPQAVFADIIMTTVSKRCRTAGNPNEMTINCGQSSFVWSTQIDMSDPAVVPLAHRSIGDKIDFICSDE